MRFHKKPVVIEALQWTGDNLPEVEAFCAGARWWPYADLGGRMSICLVTLEGTMLANPQDWIIRGVKGELYLCKPDIFAATYEPAEPPSATATTAEGQAMGERVTLGDPCPRCAPAHMGVWDESRKKWQVCKVCGDKGRVDERALEILEQLGALAPKEEG